MSRYFAMTTLAGLLLAACCGVSLLPVSMAAPAPAESPFGETLRKIAAEYRDYGRVDDEMRWAPFLCRMPMPGVAYASKSKDAGTHGQKLYSLFVKNRDAYLGLDPKKAAPVGQVLVKQSWIPEEVIGGKVDPKVRGVGVPFQQIVVTPEQKKNEKPRLFTGDHFWPYATREGKPFKAAKQADLFIMVKLDPKTPGTDNGWVYGTVTPDGKKVTSVGRIESCMKCHQDAKSDRQFGYRP